MHVKYDTWRNAVPARGCKLTDSGLKSFRVAPGCAWRAV